MKNVITLLLVVFLFVTLQAQDKKYFIYFKDKGETVNLKKGNSETILKIKETLSEEAVERRIRTKGNNIISEYDLPLNSDYLNVLSDFKIKFERKLKWLNAVSAYLSDEQVDELKSFDFVKNITEVKTLANLNPVKMDKPQSSLKKKSTEEYIYDYGISLGQMELSDVPMVHNLGIAGKDVIIGLIDTGFKTEGVPSLEGRTVLGMKDFIQDDDNTANEDGETGQDTHGTEVFSACGGFENGTLVSPAFDAKYYLAKTENMAYEKNVEEDDFVAACEWLESKGVQIVSTSLGYGEFDVGERSYSYSDMNGVTAVTTIAFNVLYDNGVVTVTSAGNDGSNQWKYISSPADAFGCIAVGAVDGSNNIAYFSSYGPTFDGRVKPEVCAQGVSTFMNLPSGKYTYSNGTSFSAPIVAGIIGQLLQAHPHLTNAQVRNIIINATENPETYDDQRGYGLLSALKAVTFPNIKKNGSSFEIHKIFSPENGINESSVSMHIINGTELKNINLSSSGEFNKYTASIPDYQVNEKLNVYFSYLDSEGNYVRVPENKNYGLTFGELNFTSVDDFEIDPIFPPDDFYLSQNYPNPFNPSTRITYQVPTEGRVKIELLDVLGQRINTLVDRIHQSGNYFLELNSANLGNLSSGVYFYRMVTEKTSITKKMMILK